MGFFSAEGFWKDAEMETAMIRRVLPFVNLMALVVKLIRTVDCVSVGLARFEQQTL